MIDFSELLDCFGDGFDNEFKNTHPDDLVYDDVKDLAKDFGDEMGGEFLREITDKYENYHTEIYEPADDDSEIDYAYSNYVGK